MANPFDRPEAEPEAVDPAIASALADVEYSHNSLERSLPKETKLSFNDDLTHVSVRGRTIRSTTAADTITLDDDDDGENPDPTTSLKSLEDYCRATLPHVRFDVTSAQLREGVEGRVDTLARYYAKRPNIESGMPFRAVTKAGAESIKMEGILDALKFKELVDDDPEAMFLELKIRTFLMIAYRSQVTDLYHTANRLSVSVDSLVDWIGHFAKADKSPARAPADGSEPDSDDDAPNSAQERLDVANVLMAEIADRDDAIAGLQATIAGLAQRLGKKGRAPRDSAAADSDQGDAAPDGSQQTDKTASTDHSHKSDASKRSAKIDSAPVYYHDKAKDTLSFPAWYRQIENKLIINADHFDTDRAKCAHIESRLGGNASANLQPYLAHTHPNAITTAKAMLQHLWNEYHDPTTVRKAKEKFRALEMQPSDDFLEFKNTFVRLAGESQFPKSEWKDEFRTKLTGIMQQYMMPAYINPETDFEAYVRYGTETALSLVQAQEKRQKVNKDSNKNPKDVSGNATTSSSNRQRRDRGKGKYTSKDTTSGAAATSSGKSALPPKANSEEIRKLMAESRCFICREAGHRTNSCPRKEEAAAIEEAHVQAVVDKYASKDKTKKKKKGRKTSAKARINQSTSDESGSDSDSSN